MVKDIANKRNIISTKAQAGLSNPKNIALQRIFNNNCKTNICKASFLEDWNLVYSKLCTK